MKTLILVRHAKAADRHKHLSDLERALTPGGQKDARRAARALKAKGIVPSLLLSSPANRALETAHIFAKELDYPVQKIALKQSAYDARDAETLFSTIRETEDHHDTIVLFGHNPSLEEFAGSILQGFAADLPKAGVIAINIDKASWRDVLPGDGIQVGNECEPATVKTSPTLKELRGELRSKIELALQQSINEIHNSGANKISSEIQEAAELLARRLAKIIKAEESV